MKHSKYRNTGLLFELLTRQITTDILNNESSSKASAILKKHFNKKSQLFKENQLFNVILESKFKDENKATHLVEYMTRKSESKESEILQSLRKENKDLRHITYKILVEKFNNKYKSLNKEQKDVLREYINNITSTSGLSDFLEGRFKDISFNLKKQLPKIEDKVIKIKIKECINLVNKTKFKNTESTVNVLKLMRFYQLLEDVRNATR